MKRLVLVGCIALIVIGITLFYQVAAYNSRSGEDAPLYSVTRFDPYGTAAIYQLLQQRGHPVRTVTRPRLEPDDTGVLIQVLARYSEFAWMPYRRLAADPLADWIADGNTIIQFTRYPTPLMSKLGMDNGVHITPHRDDAAESEAQSKPPADLYLDATASWTATHEKLVVRAPMQFLPSATRHNWKSLATLDTPYSTVRNQAHIAYEIQHGRGRLIVICSPTPILNAFLSDGDNLGIVLNLIGDKPVLFDEWSHGLGNEAGVMAFLRSAGLVPVLLQIAFVLLLYVWSTTGHRVQPVTAGARRRSSSEQIATLGYLYQRTLSPQLAFNRVHAEVTRRLSDALRCRPDQIASMIARLPASIQSHYSQLTEKLQAAQPARSAVCLSCGYELFNNQSGRCPECGTPISIDLQRRMKESAESGAAPAVGRATQVDQRLAGVLSASHQLVKEIRRERSAT